MNVRDNPQLTEELPRDAQQHGHYDDEDAYDDIHLSAEDAEDEDYFEPLEAPLHAYIPRDFEDAHLLRDC